MSQTQVEAVVALVEVVSAAAVTVASPSLKEQAKNQLTVTQLDLDAMLASPLFDGWLASRAPRRRPRKEHIGVEETIATKIVPI
ncbi:hypothetical protein PC129_g22743 [Phytophthora cactorum]|uniref:Uncharacterized protein n=1 Tax=Phytophthora cactorum TaxID=29920 RepID=A0A8T1H252_9STRA|nr:hypothetical protein Pcac1_g22015 [Phytophthora cactorum]KAG2794163.1 hypothetical protein PC111_g22723 [Phytophthora cactorum]KAG2794176.1 hypothetical protein PC112_g23141 [Phytophthora cactorum]KAG2817907.1 hypothetical protein PC113_g22918 [Phytophthora cactorum]KAG2873699.1 hypothetical protein PC114_g25708 [Phytophthora cactorum]